MEKLFSLGWYRKLIKNKQEIMIGYSDSSKEIQTVEYDAVLNKILTTYSNNPQKLELELNKFFTDVPNPLGKSVGDYLERLAKIKNDERAAMDRKFIDELGTKRFTRK